MATRMKFTSAAVERIKPPKTGRDEYIDTLLTGFYLRVTEKGKKSWSLLYRYEGKLKRMTLGKYPAVDLSDAREAARDALKLLDRGKDPLAKDDTESHKRKMTVRAVVKEYITRYAKPRNRTWKDTERTFDLYVLPEWKDRLISNITRHDVVMLIDSIMDEGKVYPARHTFAAIRKFFNWAAERGIIDASPCQHIAMPGKAVSRERVLSDEEVKAVWAAAEEMGYPFGSVVQLLMLTSMRLNEVAKAKWQDIDLEAGVWRIPRENVKTDRTHETPLTKQTKKILKSLPRFTDDYIFTSTAGKTHVSGFSKAKLRLDKLSGVADWRLHDLRRTAGTNMAKLGVPVYTISRVLNHAQGGVTAIYDRHSYMPEKKEALEKWEKKLLQVILQK